MTDTPVTTTDFLKVRDKVARVLGENSQTQPPTRVRQAERLMQLGFIDIEAVLDSFPKQTEELPEPMEES